MQTLDCKFDIKALTPEGRMTGYLSYFGNRDSQGDVVVKGAFDRTLEHLSKSSRKIPQLYQHNPTRPVGLYEVIEPNDVGLRTESQFAMELHANGAPMVPDAWMAFALAKAGILTGKSMGYEPVKGKTKYLDGDRHLLEVKLHEGSIVTFPANDLCRIEQVKHAAHFLTAKMADFATTLAATQDRQTLYRLQTDIMDAFYATISSLRWDDDAAEQKLVTLATSCDQLKSALLDWASRTLQTPAMEAMAARMVFLPPVFGLDAKADDAALAALQLAPRHAIQLAMDALSALLVTAPVADDGPGTSKEADPAADDTVRDPDPAPASDDPDLAALHSLIADFSRSIHASDAASGEPARV